MKRVLNKFKKIFDTVNFNGLYCVIKGNPDRNEIVDALIRQNEIDMEREKKFQV